jgi:polar amino acid transport system substrate-binding protein/arginine/ornithine transport system substrate-binding protein
MRSWIARALSIHTAVVALLAAAMVAPGIVHAQTSMLRIATEGTYPPWSYKDAQGQLLGWDVEIAKALCDRMKLQCEIVAQDWDGIIPGLTAKKYDAIVASMGMTEARKQRVAFTDKYKEVVSRFVARKGPVKDLSPEVLKGKKIGVQRGSIQAPFLEQNFGKIADIRLYDTPQAAELDLIAGRVDLIFGNMVTYYVGFFKQPEAKDFEFVGPEFKGGLLGDGAGIALRKEDAELVARFNKALAEIRADGTYDRITAKYFPFKLI